MKFIFVIVLSVSICHNLDAQNREQSAALKSYRAPQAPSLVRPYNENQKLWKEFMLVRDANAGDAVAQHELGLRYLLGEGFFADTAKAALWIGKAAKQQLAAACFNYGILLNNGWGVPWNPFEAYLYIQFAAQNTIPEAQYALGLFLLDNLAVARDEREAYCLVRSAADSGYAPAIELLFELEKRNIDRTAKNTAQSGASAALQQQSQNFGLIFLDFTQDTLSPVDENILLQDIVTHNDDSAFVSISSSKESDGTSTPDTAMIKRYQRLAEDGSPEALTMMGWFHEQGLIMKRDVILASVYYLRASRFDSPRAPELLWKLTQEKDYFNILRTGIEMNDANAKFVWAGLTGLGFDHQLTTQQALQMLRSAANFHNPQAMIELGICYFTGRWIAQSKELALEWWGNAARSGNTEAKIRILATNILSPDKPIPAPDDIATIERLAANGSVQAQLAKAFAYETGRGFPKNQGEAVRLYRKAAQRGSRVAYESLRRMYDALRPTTKEFIITD